ncbi:MAG TPA: glycosyltransferase family 2 protein, partial [Bryobacteraceae bacterium]
MKLSVLIPARDEEGAVEATLSGVVSTLRAARIDFEILVVDDGSRDATADKVVRAAAADPEIGLVHNDGPHGFGHAIRCGLSRCSGDAIAIMMADGSDDPADLVAYWNGILEGYDCVFGSRFAEGGRVTDYPGLKLVINRAANQFIRLLFGL